MVIEATNVRIRAPMPQQNFEYSYALDPWCLNTEASLGTISNANFWTCALELLARPGQDRSHLTVARGGHQEEIGREYLLYMANYKDAQDMTHAVIRGPDTNTSAD